MSRLITTWHPFSFLWALIVFSLSRTHSARQAYLRASESDFVPLVSWLDSASKNERHIRCLIRGLYCAAHLQVGFLLLFALLLSVLSSSLVCQGPILVSVGSPMAASSHLPARPASKEAPFGRGLVAGRGSDSVGPSLGAQPAGPIPRFALIIPDPDDPPSLRFLRGPEITSQGDPCGTVCMPKSRSCSHFLRAAGLRSKPSRLALSRPASKHDSKTAPAGPGF